MIDLPPDAYDAIRITLRVACWATIGSLPIGILVAWLLARCRFPGKFLLNALVHLPLVLPPVVTGYALLLLLGRRGLLGGFLADSFGIVLAFRWTGAAVAAAVMAFPLMVRAIRLSLEAIDPRLESAARTLGAAPGWVFLTVTLPLALPGVVAGMVICFAKSLGEFGATITFVSAIPGETRTLSAAIYAATQTPGAEPTALLLSLVAVVLSFGALLLSDLLARAVARRVAQHGGLPA